jgi:hypothetical protein
MSKIKTDDIRNAFIKMLLDRWDKRVSVFKLIPVPNEIKDASADFVDDSNPVLGFIMSHYVITNNENDKISVSLVKPPKFINFDEKRGVSITDINTDKSTIESLKDMARVGWDLSFGIAKCRYPALEVLTLDTTLPSLVIETAVEKSGSKVLKNANMGLCISITTYDAFTTPAGLDLIVKAIDLMGEE